jgi:cytochrome c oxidase assembly protein subunit 11
MMRVNPGAANGVGISCQEPDRRRHGGAGYPQYLAQSRRGLLFTKPSAFALTSKCSTVSRVQRCRYRFIVDQDLPADIHTITLSYTLFDVTGTVTDGLASR